MGLSKVTPAPKDPQKGDTLFTQPSSAHPGTGAVARDPGTWFRRGQAEGLHVWLQEKAGMGQQGQGHRFPASIKAGVAAARWAEHGHWCHGLQVLIGD